jgi:hypothetical protein
MDLDELLSAMDRAAANLAKLEDVWSRASTFIPNGPQRGSDPEYDDLQRAWENLLPGLPQIDGWTITDSLPDIDGLGQSFIDCLEISEPPFSLYEAGEQRGKDLAEYKYRLNRAQRRAARERLQQLTSSVDGALSRLLDGVPRDSRECLDGSEIQVITSAVQEMERLVGDTVQRKGRWSDLHRHLHFGQGHDWHDIRELDWPSVRADVEAAGLLTPILCPYPTSISAKPPRAT